MMPNDDAVVTRVHEEYRSRNFNPSNGYQYTVLAAFVLVVLQSRSPLSSSRENFKVISLATGSKCLPTSRYQPKGDTVHDSHAEILARRAFIRWLYEEVQRAIHGYGHQCSSGPGSEWIERLGRREDGKDGRWGLKEGVKLFMYISTVPCGDASTRFLASSQDPQMASLKDSSPPISPPQGSTSRGRNNYSLYGVLRTKPGRADSPSTICMSCSDKIAAFNVLGIQGSLASNIFGPIYVHDIIIGDVPEDMRSVVKEDCERAFYGRLNGIEGSLPEPYLIAKPTIHFTNIDFIYSRSSLQSLHPDKPPPQSSNESLCWFADSLSGNGQEVIINGIRRGIGTKQRGLEKFQPRLCKLQLFRLYDETARLLGIPAFPHGTTYHVAKQSSATFQTARASLKGPNGPFAGWLVSGKRWESFDVEGKILPENAGKLEEPGTTEKRLINS